MGYEILTLRDGEWSIEALASNKQEAETVGKQVLSRPDVSGVKVVRETGCSPDQIRDEDVIFARQKGSGASDRVFVNHIDEAPADCESPEELIAPNGRMTINRLFRSYLDKNNITASEVVHSYKEMKRVMDADALVPSAISKVAQLQSADSDSSVTERQNELFDFVQQITERARKAETKKLPRIREKGFDAAFKHLCDMAEGDEFDYLLKVTITNETLDNRNWWGKLIQVVGWADLAQDQRAIGALDGFMADALANNSVLQDLLGEQEDLGTAIISIIRLVEGSLKLEGAATSPEESPERTAAQLNSMMGASKLPDSQNMLMDKVRRQLQGSGKLTKGHKDIEGRRFKEIIERLVSTNGFVGGPGMAEAITERQSRILNKGGLTGLKDATGRVLSTLREPARKATYLLSLHESKIGKGDLGDEINDQLNSLFMRADSVHRLVKGDLPPNRKMEQITSAFYCIQNSALPESRKLQLTGRLDELLASYIVDGEILQKIDNPDRPLHVRAFMLVDMCRPEMLPRGKASDLARQIIIDSLKQPNFETELVSQIEDDQEKTEVLRRFHEQLHRCGFMG